MTLHIDIVIFSCGGVCKFEVYYCSIRGLIASLQPCRVANKKNCIVRAQFCLVVTTSALSSPAGVRCTAGVLIKSGSRHSVYYGCYEFALSSEIVVEKLVPVLVRVLSVAGSWYEFRLEFRQGGPPPTQLVRVGARGTSSHYPRES